MIEFLGCLAILSVAAEALTRGLEKVGSRLHFTQALLGLVTALGADTPEISSAFSALLRGHKNLGVGVVLGSNVFNLAGLLGLSAVVTGRVTIGRQGIWLTGGVGILVLIVASALIYGLVPAWWSMVLLCLILAPYVWLLSMSSERVARMNLPARVRLYLVLAIGHVHRDTRNRSGLRQAFWGDGLIIAVSLAAILVASNFVVQSAIVLEANWHLPPLVMGTLILAALTSVPNVVAAVQLARDGLGPAVVSETFNSNTLNLLVGTGLPALVFSLGTVTPQMTLTLVWLLGMSIFAVLAAGHRHGLHRIAGTVLILLYLMFTGAIVAWQG